MSEDTSAPKVLMSTAEEIIASLTSTEIQALFCDENMREDVHVVEEGRWEGDGKYQRQRNVIAVLGRNFMAVRERTGSYYTAYDYQYPAAKDFYEVEPVEVVKKKWRKI